MLTLRTYPAGFGTPSQSPFCVKAMLMLSRTGAPWHADYVADPRRAPKRKLPVLVDGDEIIADSWAIRAHLEKKLDIDFDEGLSAQERAQSHALARMAEEHLYFALVHDRWINESHWPLVREAYFGAVPKLIRGMVTRGIRKSVARDLDGQGMGRHSAEEIADRAKTDLDAIKAAMQGPFLMGAGVCAADYSVGSILQAGMASPGESRLKSLIQDDAELTAYVARVTGLLTGPVVSLDTAA